MTGFETRWNKDFLTGENRVFKTKNIKIHKEKKRDQEWEKSRIFIY